MAMRIESKGAKPWTVLTVVKSETGSWEYEIRTSHKDGVTYCTCKRWQFHKSCKHLDAYLQHPIINMPAASPANMPVRSKVRTPGEVLREELADLGFPISAASANAISLRVLNAGGKISSAGFSASSGDELNANNVRVIILPD
jgi:hypothetical protein